MVHPILFVDDNPVILKTIQVAFAEEPYPIYTATSGEEALPVIREHLPHIIVSDLRMTGMDGLTLLKRAREIDRHFVGMIFTAYMDIDCIMQAVSEEAVWRYIAKPWQDNRELVVAVHNAIQFYEAMEARRHAEEQLNRAGRLAALGHLVTGIAHQFNNINVGIMGYAQIAQANKQLPGEVRDHLQHIQIFAKRATRIVKELAAFSDQSLLWGFSRANISALVEEVLHLFTKEMEQDSVTLKVISNATPEVEVNAGLVKQLLANLITNAWHATLGGAERLVTVETGCQGERVFVRISDNGCGIPPRFINRIFDPFYTTKGPQAAPGSPQAAVPGIGLGLSLSQTIAQNHDGEIVVASEEGQGTQFTFWLPMAKPLPDAWTAGAP